MTSGMPYSSEPRFVVIEDHQQPYGTKRWIIYDNVKDEWADKPRYYRDDAEAVCEELNELMP